MIELDENTINKNACNEQVLNEIPVVNCDVSYSEFFQKFLISNQPCIIRNVAADWEAATKWIVDDLPNFSYLTSTYGNSCVSVHNCNEDSDYYSAKSSKWKFEDYLKYWKDYMEQNYPKDQPVYYLKDWHLKNEYPNDKFYEIPLYFASDWLNEYLVENCKDDYRFVYMGVKGTWSPFHVDVMTSYSWSCNISGQKKWILFPPGEEKLLCDHLGNIPNDVSDLKHSTNFFEIVQNPGDAIFVPSNWHHQVWNLKDTISINHNWINSSNIKNIWHTMEKNLSEVKREIQDCEDMEDFLEHCQVMLRASFSMDFEQFYEFISYIALKRIDMLENETPLKLLENRILGRNHALFDLQSIKHVLELFHQHEDVEKLNYFLEKAPCNFLETIELILEKT